MLKRFFQIRNSILCRMVRNNRRSDFSNINMTIETDIETFHVPKQFKYIPNFYIDFKGKDKILIFHRKHLVMKLGIILYF